MTSQYHKLSLEKLRELRDERDRLKKEYQEIDKKLGAANVSFDALVRHLRIELEDSGEETLLKQVNELVHGEVSNTSPARKLNFTDSVLRLFALNPETGLPPGQLIAIMREANPTFTENYGYALVSRLSSKRRLIEKKGGNYMLTSDGHKYVEENDLKSKEVTI